MAVRASVAAACALVACLLAGAALGVSMAHAGPRGPQGPAGPQGQTGRSAEVAHLGLCWDMSYAMNNNINGMDWNDVITAPVLTDGVPSCPDGQFVSIVPQAGG